MLPNRTSVPLPGTHKADLLILGYCEGKYSVYCRAPGKENRQLVPKRPCWLKKMHNVRVVS